MNFNSGKKAISVIEYFEEKASKQFDYRKSELATKEDIANVRVEMREIKSDMIKWIYFLDWPTGSNVCIFKVL